MLRIGRNRKGGSDAAFFFLFFLLIGVFETGTLYPVRLGILRVTAFSAAALFLWRSRDRETEVGIYPLFIGGFVLLALGHAFSSVYLWVSLQHALNIAFAAVLLGWAYRIFREEPGRAWERAFLFICGIAAVQLAAGIHERFVDGSIRVRGTFDNTNFFAEFMAVAGVLSFSRSLAEGGRTRIRAIAAAGAVLFLGAALTLSASRAVFLAVVPAVAFLLLSRFGWRKGGALLLAGGIPLLALLGYQAAGRFLGTDPYNYSRLAMWRSAVRIFRSHPFGVGLGGYKYFWFATQSPVEGAFVKYGKYATTAHNEFLEVLTGLGVAGLVLFLLVLLVPIFLAARDFEGIDEERRWAAVGVTGGLFVSGVHAMVDFNFHEIGLVVLDAILLGALLAWLPHGRSPLRFRVPPWTKRLGAAAAILLLAVSAATLAGKIAHRAGVSRLQRGDLSGAERMFRLAVGVDPLCDAYPDAMAAHGRRLFLGAMRGAGPDPARADSLLTEAIRWEGKAVALSPMDFWMTSRLSLLFVERYRIAGRREDLEASIDWAGRALEINPYSAERLWDRAELLAMGGRKADAANDLARAVSIEPNFCRGYAKLAELTRGTDEARSLAWEALAAKCRETAGGRTLEEHERWLLEEAGSASKTGPERNEDREPGSPPGSSPSR